MGFVWTETELGLGIVVPNGTGGTQCIYLAGKRQQGHALCLDHAVEDVDGGLDVIGTLDATRTRHRGRPTCGCKGIAASASNVGF